MKKNISWILVLVMMFSLATPVFATEKPNDAPDKGSIVIVQETVPDADGVYRLVATANTTIANVSTVILSMSIDTDVVQPMNKIETSYTEYTPVNKATDMEMFEPMGGFVSFSKAFFTRTGAIWAVSGNRAAVALTMASSSNANGTDISAGMVVGTFYFKVKEGKALSKGSIRLETYNCNNSLISELFNTPTQQNAVFIGLKNAESDLYYGSNSYVDNMDASLTYDNWNEDSLQSTTITSSALTIAVPTVTEAAVASRSLALSVINEGIDGEYLNTTETTWSIPNTTGVSISSTGVLTVLPEASEGTVTVKASTVAGSVTKEDTQDITITKAPAAAEKVLIYKGNSVAGEEISTDTIVIPDSGTSDATQAYTAQLYDQYGAEFSGTYTWTETSALTGASISPADAALTTVTIGDAIAAGSYGIKVTAEGKEASLTVTASRNAQVATSAEFSGNDTVKKPYTGTSTAAYTITVKDQYGSNLSTQPNVSWSVQPTDQGVTVDNEGNVQVTSTATTGAYIFTVNNTGISSAPTKTITIQKADDINGETINGIASISIPALKDSTGAVITGAFASAITTYTASGTSPAAFDHSWSVKYYNSGFSTETSAPASGLKFIGTENGPASFEVSNTLTSTVYARITMTVSATGETVTKDITIDKAAQIAKYAKIMNASDSPIVSDTIVRPVTGAAKVVTYSAVLYDQYGDKMTGRTWEWSNGGTVPTNVTSSNGSISVPVSASTGAFTLNAKDSVALTVVASAVINISSLQVTWPAESTIAFKDSPEYGITNGNLITNLGSLSYSATDSIKDVTGTLKVKDANSKPDANTNKVTLVFAASGDYSGVEIEKEYTLPKAVSQKEITVTPKSNQSKSYGASDLTLTYDVSGAITGQTAAFSGNLSYDVGTSAGAYSITAGSLALADNASFRAANYRLTVTPNVKFTINPASITGITTDAPSHAILANNEDNTSLDALKAKANGGSALPEKVTVSYANGTENLPITWVSDPTNKFNRKGGTYKYNGTVTTGINFNTYSTPLVATVTVTPVAVQTAVINPTSILKAKNEVNNAVSYGALGFPTTVAVTYNNSVSGENLSISTWSMTLAQLKALNPSSQENIEKTLTPTFTYPEWATTTGVTSPTLNFKVTAKYPVTVTLTTTVGSITYGDSLAAPVATQTAITNGIDTSGTFSYLYKGTGNTVYASSETPPKNAGTYQVIAELVSNDYSGSSEPNTFTIFQKEVSLNWSGYTGLVYDNTAKNVIAMAGGIVENDSCDVTVINGTQKNAGTYTATASALSDKNYKLPSDVTQTYTIAKAARNLNVSTEAIYLAGSTLTKDLNAATDTNLDNSAVFGYVSSNPSAVTVNNSGKLTAVGNGTATVTVSIGETSNYENAALKEIPVTAVTKPISAVTASGGSGDQLTAVIDGSTIKVSGFITTGASITITPTVADLGGVVANPVTISDLSSSTCNVTVGGISIPFAIDISNVKIKPADVELVDAPAKGEVDETVVTGEALERVNDAINNPNTKAEGLAAAAPDVLIQGAQQSTTASATTVTASAFIEVKVTGYEDSEDSTKKVLKLDITPKVSYEIATSGGGITTTAAIKIPNSAIKAPVKVSIVLPAGFVTTTSAILYVKHTKDNGSTEYLPVTITKIENPTKNNDVFLASWYQSSFSTLEILSDSRTGTIEYSFSDGTVRQIVYTPSDLSTPAKPLPTDSKTGNTFGGWTISGAAFTVFNDDLLDLISTTSSAFVAEPKFTPISGSSSSGGGSVGITLTFETNGGSAIERLANIEAKKVIDLKAYVPTRDGYVFEGWYSDKELKTAVTSLTMDKSMTVYAKWTETSALPFTDVQLSDWFYANVKAVFEDGLMKGTSDTTFSPHDTTNRAMIVTILHRMDGSPSVSQAAIFPDVAAGEYYADPVAWASANGIVSGYKNGNFGPADPITREQLAAILFRYAKYKNYDVSLGEVTSILSYADASAVDEYAIPAMQWACGVGLIKGTEKNELLPDGNAERCHVAAIFDRFTTEFTE